MSMVMALSLENILLLYTNIIIIRAATKAMTELDYTYQQCFSGWRYREQPARS